MMTLTLHPAAAAAAVLALSALGAASAHAQSSLDLSLAQARYEREIAACNNGSLPAPQREACVRQAGVALDRVRGGPPIPVESTSPDGRATVVAPQVGPRPSTPATATEDLRITPDGRATVVTPTDGGTVRGTVPP